MPPDVPIPDVPAIAFVIESSIAVAAEWRRILVEYLAHILRRLAETHSGNRLRIAIVSYGCADTLPSPLLRKRFFVDYQQVIKEMKDHPGDLGLGQTNSGGSRGMAALEGLAAAVELFDTLKTQSQPKDHSHPNLYHIFHIAASAPDSAKHPLCNTSPALDNLTWDALPTELKKRSINFSFLCLRLPAQLFTELFTTANISGLTSPWFQVHPAHSMSLSGFTISQQSKVTKRIIEPQPSDRPLEAKRPRLTDISPKLPSGNASTSSSTTAPPAAITQTQSLPGTMSQAPPQQTPNSQMNKAQQLMEGLRNAEARQRQLEMLIKNAENDGDKEKADAHRQEFNKLKENNLKLRQVLSTLNNQVLAARQQAEAHVQGQTTTPTTITRAQSSPVHTQKDTTAGSSGVSNDPTQTPPALQPPQVIHNRTLSGSNFPQQAGNSATPALSQQPTAASGITRIPVPGNVEAQMQKLLEQRQRNLGGGLGIPQQAPGAGHPEPGLTSGTSTVNVPSALPLPFQPGEQATGNGGNKPPMVTVWQGVFTFSGTGPAGKKEIRAHIYATSNDQNCRADTWPDVFTLVPAREPAVDFPDLREWMKRHKPVLCSFHADMTKGDGKANDTNYRMLIQLLIQKRIYATAAWTLPSGEQEHNVLIFPHGDAGLVGALFPVSGIPEMPKSSNPPVPAPLNRVAGFPPQVLNQLQQMNPEQRKMVMTRLMQHKQMQMRQVEHTPNHPGQGQLNPLMMMQHSGQAFQDPSIINQPSGSHSQPNYGNMAGISGIVGANSGPNGPSMMHLGAGHASNMTAGLSRPLGGMGAAGGNMNYDLLQSFMQRNGDSAM